MPYIKDTNINMILASLSKAINAALNLDPESKARIQKLHGKTIQIEFQPLHFIFYCQFNEGSITLANDTTADVTTTIRGTPLQMLGVMLAKQNRQRFFAEDIAMEGDAETGQLVIDLFDHLQIDWEEYLSRLTGDVPAYHAGRMFRKLTAFLTNSNNNLCADISDYLHEEARWLPSREALNDLFTDIDRIRMDTDRMEARVQRLTATEENL